MLRKSKRPAQTVRPAQAAVASVDLDFPALAVLALDVLVRLGAVGGLHVGAVPFELLARAEGGDADEHGLREGAGVGEVAERLGASLAGRDPFLVMAPHAAGNARKGLLDLQFLVADELAVQIDLPVA